MVTRRTAKKSVTVDFKGVEGRMKVADGDYELEVDEVTQEEGDKAPYFKWKFKVTGPDSAGAALYHNTSLAPQALWNLRNLLEALSIEVPDGPLEIDLTELPGLTVGGSVVNEKYEGRDSPKLVDFFPIDEEPEAPAAASKAGKKGGLEKLKADDVSEMGEDELADVVKKYKLDIDLAPLKSLRRKANAVLDKLEAAGHLEAE